MLIDYNICQTDQKTLANVMIKLTHLTVVNFTYSSLLQLD